MKMMNKVAKKVAGEKRWDMMVEVSKMQRDLDRMYSDLMADGSKEELEGLRGAIANLEYLKIKINNKRTPQEAA
jgi:hypothetical protein